MTAPGNVPTMSAGLMWLTDLLPARGSGLRRSCFRQYWEIRMLPPAYALPVQLVLSNRSVSEVLHPSAHIFFSVYFTKLHLGVLGFTVQAKQRGTLHSIGKVLWFWYYHMG